MTSLFHLSRAKLPKGIQVETYASFLRDITQRQEVFPPLLRLPDHGRPTDSDGPKRERCLELAHRAGLNVNAITKRVVELIQAFPEEAEPELPMPPHNYGITPEDEAAIRAIDWLTFDPEQRIDALIHANALARQFIRTSPVVCCCSFHLTADMSMASLLKWRRNTMHWQVCSNRCLQLILRAL